MFVLAFKLGKTRLAVRCISIFPLCWTENTSIGSVDDEMIKFIILSLHKHPDIERWNILLKWTEARSDEDPNS